MNRPRHRPAAIALAAIGLAGLLVGADSLAQLRVQLVRGPMLIRPFGLAVDPSGVLLLGIGGSRVHVYDAKGTFLRAWNVPSDGGRFRLRSVSAGRVAVAGEQSQVLAELDLQGHLLSRARDAHAFERFGSGNDFEASGAGLRFALRDGALWRLEPAPERLLVPALRWPLALFVGRLAWLALLVTGGAAALIVGVAFAARRAPRPG